MHFSKYCETGFVAIVCRWLKLSSWMCGRQFQLAARRAARGKGRLQHHQRRLVVQIRRLRKAVAKQRSSEAAGDMKGLMNAMILRYLACSRWGTVYFRLEALDTLHNDSYQARSIANTPQ